MKEMLNVECQMRAAETLRPLRGLSLRSLREPKVFSNMLFTSIHWTQFEDFF